MRVLELGSFIAGPFAGQLLGDYGADVIKVEAPGAGDPMRRWGVTRDGDSLWWPSIGRNKRSVTLDLRDERARQLVRRLAERCDVVLENFRPGVLDRWDLGYDALSAANPRLVLVHISGFGQTGPRAGEAGFGSVGEAMGGIRHTTGSPDRPPARAGISLGDALASVFGVIGTLSALLAARRSGAGQEVDVAIYEAVAALMESTMADYELGGVVRTRSGSVLPGVAPSNVYPTSDGAEVVVAANADGVFVRLCAAMARPGLADDERFATHGPRGANAAELDALVGAWTSTRACDDLLALLAEHGVPAGRIFTAPDMLRDPQYLAREMVQRVASAQGWDVPMTGVVPLFSSTPGTIRHAGPRLGQHTDEVLTELLGLDPDDLAHLHAQGVVGPSAPAPHGSPSPGPSLPKVPSAPATPASPTVPTVAAAPAPAADTSPAVHAVPGPTAPESPPKPVAGTPEVRLRDVTLRDGLQMEGPVATGDKLAVFEALVRAGVRDLELTSFVRPDRVPAMADAAELAAATADAGVERWALVLNERGAQRAVAAGMDRLQFVVSVSDEHSRRNAGRGVDAAFDELAAIVAGLPPGPGVRVEVTLATAFGCPYLGPVAPAAVLAAAERSLQAGAVGLSLADTIGTATPGEVAALVRAVTTIAGGAPAPPVGVHLHDTRGLGVANALAALDAGVDRIDGTVGGLGGCPFAPGASGNLALEDLVHVLDESGVDTGIDLEALVEVAHLACGIVGRPVDSHLARAGRRFRPLPTGAAGAGS
ncbi:MAG TPA: CoA transferase [Acidimicrobiales bacterium]|nr:CoA transferase [Acidimicrobiales bacterium]